MKVELRGKGRLGKIGNNAKYYPYNAPGKKIVMLPVKTLSEMPHCVLDKKQLTGRLGRRGSDVDVYKEMTTPIDYTYISKKFREDNKEVIKKVEELKVKPVKCKLDIERDRIKAIYAVPINPETTQSFYMPEMRVNSRKFSPASVGSGWKR